jgi:hypothetical protein
MRKKKIILIHVITWILLSVVYFFLAEQIAEWLFPGIHGVEIWLNIVKIGLIAIFFGVGTSLVINLMKTTKRIKSLQQK